MKRQLKTADEIQAEVSRLIHEDPCIVDDGEEVHVPGPRLQQPGSESNGCNWTIRSFGNASAYPMAVSAALAAVQARWNLNA